MSTLDRSAVVNFGAAFGHGPGPTNVEYVGQSFVAGGDYLNALTFYIGNQVQAQTLNYRVLLTTVTVTGDGIHPGQILFESETLTAPVQVTGAFADAVAVTLDTDHLALTEGKTYAFVVESQSVGQGSSEFVLGMSYASGDFTGPPLGTNYAGGYAFAIDASSSTETRSQAFARNWWDYDGRNEFGYTLDGDLRFKLEFQSKIIGTRKGDKIDATHSPAGQSEPTGADDFIKARGGSDTVKGLGGADTIFGGEGRDHLYGGKGRDHLYGEKGNDHLYGGKGKDYLYGGKGQDAFVFDSKLQASNVDTISGFKPAADTIWLDKEIFTHLKAEIGSTIGDKAFYADKSGTAHDRSDRIIYETDTGALFYDANGSRAGHATKIAQLDEGLHLGQADFLIV